MYQSNTNITINNEDYDIIDDDDEYFQEETHCGKLIFKYTHKDGVNDDTLNDFNIRVDMYTKNDDTSIFEAISRSILESGNNRVLTFHTRSETISDVSSDVISFVNKKSEFIKCFNSVVKKEFPKLKEKYKNIEFKGITANTKNKAKILEDFDDTKDNDIFVLASCKTIGEGVDTKFANQIVFVDPKQSYSEIIQNIGRICRKQNQMSTVLIPCHIDINKYKKCKTKEEKDVVIRSEMNNSGNFSTILNVLSALRHEDPFIFEMCLQCPNTYSLKEIDGSLKKNAITREEKEYTLIPGFIWKSIELNKFSSINNF